ncbi:MAG: tRNA (adenosine(37)-N6)-threonylcarbamoyltransferase complex dimerization subunit type 1 TsaB [Gammaproteobacteria bacterium]|nr:tRNA (adenosine(37)-N6)-threonylcarbamoyltransferase complex dimerization subunit type 1 TsaB [Gammaproteobacteria bacterium]
MSNLLVIDTSSSVCTVALVHGGQNTVKQLEGARTHGQFLLSTIAEVTSRAGIDLSEINALAIVSGPGSFTGIRIGVGVVQGLGTALDIPVIQLSSLEWLGYTAFEKYACSTVLVCQTARDSEYYLGVFTQGRECSFQRLDEERVVVANSIEIPAAVQDGVITGVGDGWMDLDAFDPGLLARLSKIDATMAGDVGTLCKLATSKQQAGHWVAADQVRPSYLKENMHYKTAL